MLHLPKIRLEIEGMKYQIVHVLAQHHDEIEAEIERSIEQAIAVYPFESEILTVAKDAISQSIKESVTEYFRYGDGRKLIDGVVKSALNDMEKK